MPSRSERAALPHQAVRVVASLEALLGELGPREPFITSDSKSGSRFERVSYRGHPMVLKYVSLDDDWIMRGTGDLECRALRFFSSALAKRIPDRIDHATVAVAPNPSRRGHPGAVMLLRDVSGLLVPPGDATIDIEQHLRFIDNMPGLHATFWGWRDAVGLMPLPHHSPFLTPTMADVEARRGGTDPGPKAVGEGWRALDRAAPRTASTLRDLANDPGAPVTALEPTPHTLVQADWKLGNLGEHPDGRTILLDWDRVGEAPPTLDLSWYLAVNSARLPH